MLQPEGVLQPIRQLQVDGTGVADLDPYETGRPGDVQQPGHLEPTEVELLGDLDLGLAVHVVATCHRRSEDHLGWSRHQVPRHPLPPPAHLSGRMPSILQGIDYREGLADTPLYETPGAHMCMLPAPWEAAVAPTRTGEDEVPRTATVGSLPGPDRSRTPRWVLPSL